MAAALFGVLLPAAAAHASSTSPTVRGQRAESSAVDVVIIGAGWAGCAALRASPADVCWRETVPAILVFSVSHPSALDACAAAAAADGGGGGAGWRPQTRWRGRT
jgi:hypothetical protein